MSYPMKSMAGVPVEQAELTLQGLRDDRRFAFVQRQSRSAFPWLTAREHAALVRYRPRWSTADGRRVLEVLTPAGQLMPVPSDELCAELEAATGRPLFLLQDHRGSQDVAQVSLISLATVDRIAALSGTAPQPARFRANLYLANPEGEPFAEDAWVGRVLRVGEQVRIAITQPDDRCAMITVDPDTAETNPAVLRAVAAEHGNKAGVYGVVLTPGTVRRDDPVYLE